MIPRVDIELDSALPQAATFWMPAEDEIHEEGIGFFRDVWAIFDVPLSKAAEVVAHERTAAMAVDAVATDAASFEHFARLIEAHNPDFPSEEPDDEADMAKLAEYGDVDSISLCGLELGVAGLSYALAAIGCIPAASCRSHSKGYSWADWPVVVAAIDRVHAEWLQPLVDGSSCGFGLGDGRPTFLAIHARSITDMMGLAAAILINAEDDPPAPLCWGPSAEGLLRITNSRWIPPSKWTGSNHCFDRSRASAAVLVQPSAYIKAREPQLDVLILGRPVVPPWSIGCHAPQTDGRGSGRIRPCLE